MAGRESLGHRKRHVVFVADTATVGGAADALAELCYCLTETGEYRCTVLTAQDSPFNRRLEGLGARTVVTHHGEFLVARPRAGWKVPAKWTLCLAQYVLGLVVAVREAEGAVDFDDVDVIHTNVPRNDLGMLLSRRHAVPHVVHLRECSFSHFKCWSYRRDPVGYLARGADAFVGISRYVTRYWAGLGLPKERIRTIYDGVQTPERRGAACGGGGEAIRLLFLGGYVEAKGTRDAVEAVALLADPASSGMSSTGSFGPRGSSMPFASTTRWRTCGTSSPRSTPAWRARSTRALAARWSSSKLAGCRQSFPTRARSPSSCRMASTGWSTRRPAARSRSLDGFLGW